MPNPRTVKELNPNEDGPSGWSLEVDDRPFEVFSHVRLANPTFGELKIGCRPEGFVGWSFHERGGGRHNPICHDSEYPFRRSSQRTPGVAWQSGA